MRGNTGHPGVPPSFVHSNAKDIYARLEPVGADPGFASLTFIHQSRYTIEIWMEFKSLFQLSYWRRLA